MSGSEPPEGGETSAAEEAETPSEGFVSGVLTLLREVAIVVVLALVLSVVAKTFLVQSFFIPSDSMNDTLIRDDRVVVSKLTPGPFDLSRGDVVVFEDPGHWLQGAPRLPEDTSLGQRLKDGLTWVGILPSQEDNHLIKRVIGLPGDHVRCCTVDGRLEVNGTEVSEGYLYPGDAPSGMPFDVTVPEGRVWVMGDHRSDSSDSRYHDTNPQELAIPQPGAEGYPDGLGTDPRDHTGYFGSVPIDRVVGRAVAIVWPLGRLTTLGGQDATFGSVPAPSPGASAPSPTGP